MRYAIAFLVFLAGCASAPSPTPEPSAAPVPPPLPESKPAPSETVAIAGLLQSARSDSATGRLTNAAATLERALRIEPRNPRLWQELARVRLKQGEYAQAESVASRSNSFAGADNALRADNWRLIAQSREARGNADGARQALETAERFGR